MDEAGGECCLLPQRVQGLPPVAEIALGSCHALARLRNGELLAWGCNDAGQLGQGHACNEERHGHPERVRFRSAGEDDEEDEEDEDEDEDNEDENEQRVYQTSKATTTTTTTTATTYPARDVSSVAIIGQQPEITRPGRPGTKAARR